MKGNCFTHCTMNLANVQEKHQSCTEKNIWPQNCWGLWTLAGPKPPLQQGPMTVGVWSKFLIYLYNKTTNYWFLIFLSVRFGDIRCWSKWDNVSHIMPYIPTTHTSFGLPMNTGLVLVDAQPRLVQINHLGLVMSRSCWNASTSFFRYVCI